MFERMEKGIWQTQDGRIMSPDEMDERHRVNLLAFLRRRAESMHNFYTWDQCFADMPDPDTAALAILDDEFARTLNLDPQEWLETFPLVDRLIELVEG